MKKSYYYIIFVIFMMSPVMNIARNNTIIDSLKTELIRQNADTIKLKIYREIANKYLNINMDSCILYFEKSLEIAKKQKNHKYRIKTYLRIASVYFFKKEYLNSLEYLNLVDNLISKYPQKDNTLAYVLYYRSAIYASMEEYVKSKDYANKALALFIKLNDARGISEVYSILIEIYNGRICEIKRLCK